MMDDGGDGGGGGGGDDDDDIRSSHDHTLLYDSTNPEPPKVMTTSKQK